MQKICTFNIDEIDYRSATATARSATARSATARSATARCQFHQHFIQDPGSSEFQQDPIRTGLETNQLEKVDQSQHPILVYGRCRSR